MCSKRNTSVYILIEKWFLKLMCIFMSLHRALTWNICIWKTEFSLNLYHFCKGFAKVHIWGCSPRDQYIPLYGYCIWQFYTTKPATRGWSRREQCSVAENMTPRESVVWYLFEKVPYARWCNNCKIMNNITYLRTYGLFHHSFLQTTL